MQFSRIKLISFFILIIALLFGVFSVLIDNPPVYIFTSFLVVLGLVIYLILQFNKLQGSLKISQRNEALYKDLVNAQPAGIYRLLQRNDINFSRDQLPPLKYEFISEQHEIITGISNSDLFTKSKLITRMIHFEDLQGFYDKNYEAVKTRKPFKWEGRIFKDGKVRWLRIESEPRVLNEEQTLWTGIVFDITQQKRLEVMMDKRKAFERLLLEISSHFVNISVERFDEILNLAIKKIGKFCDIDRSYIFIWHETTDTLQNTHEWCNKGITPQIEYLQELPCSEIPQWMAEINKFNPINIYDVSQLPKEWDVEKQILEPQEVKSLFVVPIISQKKLVGFVGFDSVRKKREWVDYEVKILKVFADLVYNAFERKKAEIGLTQSRQMLRNVLDTIKVRVFWKDLNLNYLGCNQAFARDAGLHSTEELIGKNDFDMVWTDQAALYQADDRLVIQSRKPKLNFEEPQTGPLGEQRWLLTSKIPLEDINGQIMGVLGTYQDITEQKQAEDALKASEKKYRILTENAFDGIYLLENERFKYVNQRFCEITGLSAEEICSPDFSLWSLFTEKSKQIAEERKQARLQGKEIPGIYELQIKRKTGEICDIEISTTPLSTKDKIVILGIMRDITERKHNETLRSQVAVANQTVLFKQNFLANMSHEIRTPLTGVLGMIEILSKTRLDHKQLDYVNTLRLSTENLREIINQILDYSKIEAGQLQLKMRQFRKDSMFENAKKLYSSICKKDITLETYIDPKLPEVIEADEYRISQIINNLLSNAVKFTHKGKIIIEAQPGKWLDEQNLLIKIMISDTGIGISPESMERLFNPFEQIETDDTRNIDGTGLGLSICKELVALMDGEIGADSSPGEGSIFWFTFKAKIVTDKRKEDVPDIRSIQNKLEKTKALSILFAEDKVVNQKVVFLMLKSLGHNVSLARNGKEVVSIFDPEKFDLILMDIQMPVMDGVTATKLLKEKYKTLPPIVGLSANAFEGDREKYMNLGMDEYLTKPVSSCDFKNLIDRLFNN